MNRRSFLMAVGGLLPATVGCRRSPPAPAASGASRPAPNAVAMDVAVPGLLFFPECRSGSGAWPAHCTTAGARVTGMQRAGSEDDQPIEVVFANGMMLTFPGGASYAALTAANRGRGRRQAVMLKSLIAWMLDSVWQRVRREESARGNTALKAAFFRLQRLTVLESATLASVFELLKEMDARSHRLTDIQWMAEQTRFVVA